MPYGYGEAKDNRLCPKCLSLERHRLMYLYLKEKTNFFTDNLDVLHIAPEQPFLKRFRTCKNLNYTTADIDSPIADIKLDVMKINLPDNSYDFIICNHVLEHVEDANIALKELYRILRPQGQAILLVPINPDINTFEDPNITDPKERERLFGQYDHVRQFGKDYPEYIKRAGFDVIEDRIYYEIPEKEREKMQLARYGEEVIYGGRKIKSEK
jgi:SAM-dependent methyltransferase